MKYLFVEDEYYQGNKYDGINDTNSHLMTFQTTWELRQKEEWVHAFIHTLDEIPWIWYVSAELEGKQKCGKN